MRLSENPRSGGSPSVEAQGERLLLSWLHVSDIHFGHGHAGHQWDQKLVASDLQRDVQSLVGGMAPRPSLVFVTGDVAFSGGQCSPVAGVSEYGLAAGWLDELARGLGLSRDSILLVPGNHDVDRSLDTGDREIARLVRGARMGLESIDELFEHSDEVERLRRRQASFLEFARGFGPKASVAFEQGLWWRHRIELDEGISLRLCGLNTALLSADDQDRGALRAGNRQLTDLFLPAPAELEIVVVLSHHPLTGKWLADEAAVRRRLDREAALHLFGHLHESDSEQARHGWGTGCLRIAAGAAHAETSPSGESIGGHGYNLGALVLLPGGELVVRIWPRRWSSHSARFVADTSNIDERKGYAEHYLRQRVRRAPPRALGEGFTLCQRYQLVEKLGEGGVGQVWMAIDKGADSDVVAVKILNPDGRKPPRERRESFFRGPSEMTRVDHPSIVRIHDAQPDRENKQSPYDFYVMAYVPGENLCEVFTRRPCTDAQVVTMLIAIAEALAAAHERGVIHRDLKPSNILRGKDGRLTIVDFDTARDLGAPTRTRTGGHLVSDLYASPEVLDRRPVDTRADVYSLAVTAMFLCRGEDPPKSFINRMEQLAFEVASTPGLGSLLAKASAHEVNRRHADIYELLDALRGLALELGGSIGDWSRAPKPEQLDPPLHGPSSTSPTPCPSEARAEPELVPGAAPRTEWPASPSRPYELTELRGSVRPTEPWGREPVHGAAPSPISMSPDVAVADPAALDDEVLLQTFRSSPSTVSVALGLLGVLAFLGVLWSSSRDDPDESTPATEDEVPTTTGGEVPLKRAPPRYHFLASPYGGSTESPTGLGLVGTGRGGGGMTGSQVQASVQQGKAVVGGSLDPDIVGRIVRAHRNELHSCYQTALTHRPGVKGRVTVGFSIDEQGTVPSAEVRRSLSTMTDTGLSECLTSAVLQWRFPRPQDGSTSSVVIPFDFGPHAQSG